MVSKLDKATYRNAIDFQCNDHRHIEIGRHHMCNSFRRLHSHNRYHLQLKLKM